MYSLVATLDWYSAFLALACLSELQRLAGTAGATTSR
jgi:hypothetical protein